MVWKPFWQWRNRWGAEWPQRLSTGKFLATDWEKRGRGKGKKLENVEENGKK